MKICIKFFIVLLFLASCSSSLKEIQYLSNNDIFLAEYAQISDYQLKPGDNIYVQIIGNNPMVVNNYNTSGNYLYSQEAINLFSHTIDSKGKIYLPLVGEMKIGGMSIEKARDNIVARAVEFYRNPSVIVKLVNKDITVLGEVNRPGKYIIFKDKLNIFEALGLAGDVNDFGNRKHIKLIREVDGKEEIVNIDLTDSNIVNSDYYIIYPNDVLYVPPRNRVYGTKTLSFTGILSTSLSVISTIISIVLLIR
jgi:polysaccharide export outer membrane protein